MFNFRPSLHVTNYYRDNRSSACMCVSIILFTLFRKKIKFCQNAFAIRKQRNNDVYTQYFQRRHYGFEILRNLIRKSSVDRLLPQEEQTNGDHYHGQGGLDDRRLVDLITRFFARW